MRSLVAVFCATAVLAGCAGGSALPPSHSGQPALRMIHRDTLHLRIKIPKRHVRRGTRSHYVSPATQGMTVALSGPTTMNVTVGLTTTSGGCQSELASTVCQFTYAVAPGSYTATLKTYDAVSGCPSACAIPGSAKELSAAQSVGFTVTPGQANNVNLTLSGVPNSIVVFPLGSSSVLNVKGGIDLYGTAAHKLFIEAFDADGNVIFGQGAPSFAAALGTGSLAVTLGQTSAASPNIFTVTPPATFAGTTRTINITASYGGGESNGCAQPGAVCSASVTVAMAELYATISYSQAFVFVAGQTSALASISSGINNPNALAFDRYGNLYVANCLIGCNVGTSPDNIAVFAPPYNGTPFFITNGIVDPQTLAFSPSGQLIVGNCGACSVGGTDDIAIYTPPFSSSSVPSATNTSGIVGPISMAFDSHGNLFVADCASCAPGGNDAVTEYAFPYTGPAASLSVAGLNHPVGIALDASDNVFVANTNGGGGGGYVVEYSAPNYISAVTITHAADATVFADPVWVAADAGGTSIVIADNTANKVFLCGPAFTANCGSGSTIATGVSSPQSVVEDGAGNLYVSNAGGANDITSYAAGAFTGAATTVTTNNTPFNLAVLP